jgi:hypothetical protein
MESIIKEVKTVSAKKRSRDNLHQCGWQINVSMLDNRVLSGYGTHVIVLNGS